MDSTKHITRGKNTYRTLSRIFTALVLVFLYAPVVVTVIFSFNNSYANVVWNGFTWDYYRKLFTDREMWKILANTLIVAGGSTLLGTVIGTTGAVGFRSARFRGKKLISASIYFPLVLPEIVLAAALLMLFNITSVKLSLWTVLVGNTTLVLPYVFINVRARLTGMDPSLEEASMDLGAGRFYTFLHVTLPYVLPGVLAGAFMSFSLTIDELIITSFLADAQTTTLPVRVYSMLKRGISPEINALTTIILLVSFLFVGIYVLRVLVRRRQNMSEAERIAGADAAIQNAAGADESSAVEQDLVLAEQESESRRRSSKIRVIAAVCGIAVLFLAAFLVTGPGFGRFAGGAGTSGIYAESTNGSGTGADPSGDDGNGTESGGTGSGSGAPATSADAIRNYGTDTINLLIWSGFWSEEVFDDFTRETGIRVNVSYIDNTDVLLAKLLEGSADYDVIDLETGYVESFIRNGLLAKLNKDNIPNRHNIEDQYFTKIGAPVGDENEDYVIPDMAPLLTTILYNKYTCPIVPTRLSDLADPRLRGQVAMVNSTISLYGGALADLGYSPDSIDPEEMKEANDLLMKIKPNVKAFVGESAAAQLKNGECSVAYCWDYNVLCNESRDNWDKFVFVQLPCGVEYAPQYWAVPSVSRHQAAAEAFINFECRPEESAKNLNEYGGAPIMKRELIERYLPDGYYDSPIFEADEKAFPKSWKIAVRDDQQALMDQYYTELMSGVSTVDE